MKSRNATNQRTGASFEAAFEFMANVEGLLCVRNGQAVRWLPQGKMVAVKSNLDWTVLDSNSRVAWLDTKSFSGATFPYSALTGHQLQRALAFEGRGFLAGFVVHFRQSNEVAFFTGTRLQALGSRRTFAASDGVLLGTLNRFSVAMVWRDWPKPRCAACQ